MCLRTYLSNISHINTPPSPRLPYILTNHNSWHIDLLEADRLTPSNSAFFYDHHILQAKR